jgi:hypothetical protein
MLQPNEANVLADVFQDVRNLTKFYLRKTEGIDPLKFYEIEGTRLNSLYWLVGHLVWTEHHLLVTGMSGESMPIPWLESFEFGSDPAELSTTAGLPSFEEILGTLDDVHDQAMANVRSLTDEALLEPNLAGLRFAAGDSRRTVIRHAIRHEPMHVGQISWICKINGAELF